MFSGSFVVSGHCKAKVEKIGEDSYIEKLAKQAKVYKKPESKILKSLNVPLISFFCRNTPKGSPKGL